MNKTVLIAIPLTLLIALIIYFFWKKEHFMKLGDGPVSTWTGHLYCVNAPNADYYPADTYPLVSLNENLPVQFLAEDLINQWKGEYIFTKKSVSTRFKFNSIILISPLSNPNLYFTLGNDVINSYCNLLSLQPNLYFNNDFQNICDPKLAGIPVEQRSATIFIPNYDDFAALTLMVQFGNDLYSAYFDENFNTVMWKKLDGESVTNFF
jgi:hypothetical protein